MAKIVEWEDIQPGMELHEEWVFGSTTFPVTVISKGENTMVLESGTTHNTIKVRRTWEYRYWDSEPTLDEREVTRFYVRSRGF